MEQPLVSVIIPVYNGERYLAEAIESVLAQTYRPIEVIVVNDGSTDGSADIAQSYKIRYIYQPNQGVAVARNAGIAAARGDLIAFLDQDDLWAPNKLSVQVDYLLKHPRVDYVIAKQRIFLESGTVLPSWLKSELLENKQSGFLPGTLVARKTVFERIGNFDSAYKVGSDADWFFRAKDTSVPLAILDQVLLRKRVHSDNESYQASLSCMELLKVARTSIKRQYNQKTAEEQ
jgi:glycosyltransferase involved in cell wall biosynthesis